MKTVRTVTVTKSRGIYHTLTHTIKNPKKYPAAVAATEKKRKKNIYTF